MQSCWGSWFFLFSSRRRHTRCLSDWSSDVCSSDLRGRVRVYGLRKECAGRAPRDSFQTSGGHRAASGSPTEDHGARAALRPRGAGASAARHPAGDHRGDADPERSDYPDKGHVVDRMFAISLGQERLHEQSVVCLCARRPLVTWEDIDQFVALTSSGAEDGVFSAVEIDLSSIRQSNGRTLAPGKAFADTGALYAFRRASLHRAGAFARLNLRPCLLSRFHSLPFETKED